MVDEQAPKLIAFYLPQFHPIPENDEWWGRGFTEWRNVVRGTPAYDGHHQPHLPADLGFYDLRVPEVRDRQADLARQYGVHGFCYYYYWFGGRRLLERPLLEVVQSGRPDFPFCICWANENWTRRWDGRDSEVLIGQHHSSAEDEAFILDLIPILSDPRYIRVDGKPLILVYRLALFPDPAQTARTWRRVAAEHGIAGLQLCAVHTSWFGDPRIYGFDAAAEFPPHTVAELPDVRSRLQGVHPGFQGRVVDYQLAMDHYLARPPVDYPLYRTVMARWDNSARRGENALIFHNATPALYRLWLGQLIRQARHTPGREFVFINAWNEWAEGAHLEPDVLAGHSYLEVTRQALDEGPGSDGAPSLNHDAFAARWTKLTALPLNWHESPATTPMSERSSNEAPPGHPVTGALPGSGQHSLNGETDRPQQSLSVAPRPAPGEPTVSGIVMNAADQDAVPRQAQRAVSAGLPDSLWEIHEEAKLVSDEEWFMALRQSVDGEPFHGHLLPAFAPADVQRQFVGSSGVTALNEAWIFTRVVLRYAAACGVPLDGPAKMLDFGCGWGRYTRFLLKYTHPDNIYGVDVNSGMIEQCRKNFGGSNFSTVSPFPPTIFRDSLFDLVLGYSVFSHLSPACADAWIEEFARVVRPGGIVLMTTQGRDFIDFCRNIRRTGDLSHPWYRSLAVAFVDEAAAHHAYDEGRYLFTSRRGEDATYGEALISRGYIEQHWLHGFELVDFVDDRSFLPQALFVLQRK